MTVPGNTQTSRSLESMCVKNAAVRVVSVEEEEEYTKRSELRVVFI